MIARGLIAATTVAGIMAGTPALADDPWFSCRGSLTTWLMANDGVTRREVSSDRASPGWVVGWDAELQAYYIRFEGRRRPLEHCQAFSGAIACGEGTFRFFVDIDTLAFVAMDGLGTVGSLDPERSPEVTVETGTCTPIYLDEWNESFI